MPVFVGMISTFPGGPVMPSIPSIPSLPGSPFGPGIPGGPASLKYRNQKIKYVFDKDKHI